jgi:hypothetical protein
MFGSRLEYKVLFFYNYLINNEKQLHKKYENLGDRISTTIEVIFFRNGGR